MTRNTEVVVIGGGYAGVLAANRMTQHDDVTVTLINPRPTFVQRIRLHQLVAGTDDALTDYGKILGESVRLVVDTATRIDADRRRVTLESGGSLGYDYLIYAVGSASPDAPEPGVAEFAYPIATLEDAQRLRTAVEAASPTDPLTVVGGGPAGIETAAELAEQGRDVTLVCGGVLAPYLHANVRRTAAKRLAGLGVTIVEGPGTIVTAVTRDAVRLEDGRELPSKVTVWTAGFSVPDLAARSGLSTDAVGRMLTDETLTSVDDERIIATGDAASPSNLPFRMSCQAAVQLGPGAADTVLSRIAGERPEAPNVANAAMCLSLGRRSGIFQISSFHDSATRFYFGGRSGAKIKEYICAHMEAMLANEGRKPGSLKWKVKDRKRARQLKAERSDAPVAAGRAA